MLYAKLLKHTGFPGFEDDENYLESIKVMMHSLWDDTL
jgi:ferredoxin-nitrite reductase